MSPPCSLKEGEMCACGCACVCGSEELCVCVCVRGCACVCGSEGLGEVAEQSESVFLALYAF